MTTRLSTAVILAILLSGCAAKRPVQYRVAWTADFNSFSGHGECMDTATALAWVQYEKQTWPSFHYRVEACVKPKERRKDK
jgi:hypothetical protein